MSCLFGYSRFSALQNVLCCSCTKLQPRARIVNGESLLSCAFSPRNHHCLAGYRTFCNKQLRVSENGVNNSCIGPQFLLGSKRKSSVYKYRTYRPNYFFNCRLRSGREHGCIDRVLNSSTFTTATKAYQWQHEVKGLCSSLYVRTLYNSSPCSSDFNTEKGNQVPSKEIDSGHGKKTESSPKETNEPEKVKSTPNKQIEDKQVKSTSKLKQFMTNFMNGLKQLWKDIKLAVSINRKLREYDYDASQLSREELIHLKQTKKDVIKTAPVTFFFFLPFIGYLAPVLAYLYPKKLLSRQFWHPEQKKQFRIEDHAKRSQYYLPLIREVGWACKESKDKELLKVVMNAIDGHHISNHSLLEQIENFEADEDISLKNMPRYHLVKLCKTWMIPAKWYMPRKLLMEGLTWRVKNIVTDDDAIRRDGLSAMTAPAVKQACHNRGLEEVLYTDEALAAWMVEWLDLTKTVNPDCHISFVAHCAVFKSLNYCKEDTKCQEEATEVEEKSIKEK